MQVKTFYIVGGDGYNSYGKPFIDYGMVETQSAKEADVLVFCGGVDVHPSFYGVEAVYHESNYNISRDKREAELYGDYPEKWKVGICRGSQFLNVMNGGTLIQDMQGHAVGRQHTATFNGNTYDVTSTHHQGSILGDGGLLLSESVEKLSKEYVLAPDIMTDDEIEVEAYIYPDTKTIGMQFHPEFVDVDDSCAVLFRDILKQEMG